MDDGLRRFRCLGNLVALAIGIGPPMFFFGATDLGPAVRVYLLCAYAGSIAASTPLRMRAGGATRSTVSAIATFAGLQALILLTAPLVLLWGGDPRFFAGIDLEVFRSQVLYYGLLPMLWQYAWMLWLIVIPLALGTVSAIILYRSRQRSWLQYLIVAAILPLGEALTIVVIGYVAFVVACSMPPRCSL